MLAIPPAELVQRTEVAQPTYSLAEATVSEEETPLTAMERTALLWASTAVRAILRDLGLPEEAQYAVLSYLARDPGAAEQLRQAHPYPLTREQINQIVRLKSRADALMQEVGLDAESDISMRWQLLAKLADPGPFGR